MGLLLRHERELNGWTQQRCADIAGVSVQTQRNYESGRRSPDALYLHTMAAVGLDVLSIITGQRATNHSRDDQGSQHPLPLDLTCERGFLDDVLFDIEFTTQSLADEVHNPGLSVLRAERLAHAYGMLDALYRLRLLPERRWMTLRRSLHAAYMKAVLGATVVPASPVPETQS